MLALKKKEWNHSVNRSSRKRDRDCYENTLPNSWVTYQRYLEYSSSFLVTQVLTLCLYVFGVLVLCCGFVEESDGDDNDNDVDDGDDEDSNDTDDVIIGMMMVMITMTLMIDL